MLFRLHVWGGVGMERGRMHAAAARGVGARQAVRVLGGGWVVGAEVEGWFRSVAQAAGERTAGRAQAAAHNARTALRGARGQLALALVHYKTHVLGSTAAQERVRGDVCV
jgi:hypothetical protein